MAKRVQEYVLEGPGGERLPVVTNLAAFCREQGWKIEAVRKVVDTGEPHQGFRVWRRGNEPGELPPAASAPSAGLPPAPKMPDPSRPRDEIKRSLQRYVAWIVQCNSHFTAHPAEKPEDWKVKEQLGVAETFAKFYGIDWRDVSDQRTPEESLRDLCERLLLDGEEALTAAEEVIDVIEATMSKIDRDATDYHAERNQKAAWGRDGPKVWAERARRWRDLFRRVRVLRARAREPYDPGIVGVSEVVQRATHVLRFQLFVGRSDLPAKSAAGKVFKMGRPQIAMAMSLFYAMNGYGAVPGVGLLARGEVNPATGATFEGVDYKGIVILIPPRHGKTDFLKHETVLTMNLQPDMQSAYVHAVDLEAESMNKAVASYFDKGTAQGRRNLSLFPVELADYDNNAGSIRLKTRNPPRTAQHTAAGINSSKLGKNLDRIRGDDLVPTSDRFNPTDRAKRISTWDTTWMSRRQGPDSFVMISGYPHHREDLIWQYAQKAKAAMETGGRAGMLMYLLRMPVGGPDSEVPFRPIFPELYDAKALRGLYRSLQDVTMWPSNYMLTPQTREQQIVQEVRLYDAAGEEHRRFMADAQIFVSVDPAAKGDGTGDKVGIVIGALGDTRGFVEGEHATYATSERQLRVIFETEFHATQSEITQNLLDLGQRFRVDRVFIECVTGLGSAIAEMLAHYHGAHAVETEGVKNQNKAARLKAVSGMVENSIAQAPAKVLFPGVLKAPEDGGRMVLSLDPAMERLVAYIVDFAVTSGHHSLDAFTLLCRKLMHEVGVGEGQFSKEVQQAVAPGNDVTRMLDGIEKRRRFARGRGGFQAVLRTQGA